MVDETTTTSSLGDVPANTNKESIHETSKWGRTSSSSCCAGWFCDDVRRTAVICVNFYHLLNYLFELVATQLLVPFIAENPTLFNVSVVEVEKHVLESNDPAIIGATMFVIICSIAGIMGAIYYNPYGIYIASYLYSYITVFRLQDYEVGPLMDILFPFFCFLLHLSFIGKGGVIKKGNYHKKTRMKTTKENTHDHFL